jgi:hypothetical protein
MYSVKKFAVKCKWGPSEEEFQNVGFQNVHVHKRATPLDLVFHHYMQTSLWFHTLGGYMEWQLWVDPTVVETMMPAATAAVAARI